MDTTYKWREVEMYKTYLSYCKKIKNTKSNAWFRETFLPSFGKCHHKPISEKQGEIFKRYLEEVPENWKHANADYYSGIVNGLFVKLQASGAYNGSMYTVTGRKTLYRTIYSLTIADDQTEREIAIRKELETLEEKIDAMYEENPGNPLIDIEEEKEADLERQLGEIYKSYS